MIGHFNFVAQCAFPENIHTHPEESHWKFQGGVGSQKPKFLRENMKQNWNFQRGGGLKPKKLSVGGVWIFSGTTL